MRGGEPVMEAMLPFAALNLKKMAGLAWKKAQLA